MIQKIQSSEYMKRFDNMSAVERDEYLKRVGEWFEKQKELLVARMNDQQAQFLNVIQVSAAWNDAECLAWTEGARLLTALVATGETWLPEMLYVKAARRAIRNMVSVVSGFRFQVSGLEDISRDGIAGQKTKQAVDTAGKPAGTAAGEKPARTAMETAGKPAGTAAGKAGENHAGEPHGAVAAEAVPVRPKHIDQYVHLLPAKTQERAATVKGLLRDLDVARENARRLMDAGEHGDKIAQWAKAATKLDEKVKAIYKELDAEWDKLVQSGRVVVDEFGNARVVEAAGETEDTADKTADESAGTAAGTGTNKQGAEATDATGKGGESCGETQDTAAETPTNGAGALTSEQRERVRALRHFLKDTRRGNGRTREEHVRKWKASYTEMVAIAGPGSVTDKVKEAAEHYGINLAELQSNCNAKDENNGNAKDEHSGNAKDENNGN